ncbi:MAG: CE1759 family FMN reductase [Ancrocorticia sp.]|uniref:CE1759 family FMN reductase n=1 Tax=Ancrocorticia sp. TaxID=2593684 RepID=UPI003F91E75E
MKVLAISAGTSDTSASTRLAKKIGDATDGQIELIGLKAYARDIADAITMGFPSARLDEVFAQVAAADAVVAVTPIYNAMPSGLFISFFDVLPEGTLQGKPVALGATGGTPRHSLVIEQAVRPMFVYLHATVPTTAVYAATEDWGAHGEGFEGSAGRTLGARIRREGEELANLAAIAGGDVRGLAPVAQEPVPPAVSQSSPAESSDNSGLAATGKSSEQAAIDEFPDFIPFDQLLK